MHNGDKKWGWRIPYTPSREADYARARNILGNVPLSKAIDAAIETMLNFFDHIDELPARKQDLQMIAPEKYADVFLNKPVKKEREKL